MKTFKASLKVNKRGELTLPDSIKQHLKPGQSVRLVLLVDELASATAEDQAWSRLSAEQFFAHYDEADSVYDSLE